MRHPREGWSEGGRRAPREMSRRDFLGRAGAASAALGLGTMLGTRGIKSPIPAGRAAEAAAEAAGSHSTPSLPLPRQNHPVRWPIFSDNRPIASNLKPEEGATLQIYNWVAYINEDVIKSFCKKYKCKYSLTTFNTMTEAIAKLATGEFQFDIFFPTIDVIGQLIETKLMRPLNHSYIPNIANCWPDYKNPFYDEGWQYTVPYSIYTTGMAWRKDKVSLKPSWSMPWEAKKYKGKVALLDDNREGPSLALMKMGIYDLNTTSPAQLRAAGAQLRELESLVNIRIDNSDYTEIPSGNTWIHQAWSGDMASSYEYLPKGTSVDVIGYWFPPDGKGPIANDIMSVLTSGKNPVLSHLFLNYMLNVDNALNNYSYVGYMQPMTAVTAPRLVKEKLLPPQLESTVVKRSYFKTGVMELELPESANLLWEQTWNSFSQGL